jgi:hypothetical protein
MTPEELADVLTLADIETRLKLLDHVIREAQADGDERWKTTAKPQAEILNAARGILMKRQRQSQGEPEPEAATIQARVGFAKAKQFRG